MKFSLQVSLVNENSFFVDLFTFTGEIPKEKTSFFVAFIVCRPLRAFHNRSLMFSKIGGLKIFAKLLGKHLCRSLIRKLQASTSWRLLLCFGDIANWRKNKLSLVFLFLHIFCDRNSGPVVLCKKAVLKKIKVYSKKLVMDSKVRLHYGCC